jgi:tyrosyl-tRNA synthetase
MPTVELTEDDFKEDSIDIITMLTVSGLAKSRSDGRKNVEQGGVSIDGEKITDIHYTMPREAFEGDGVVLKRGKKNFKKICLK